MFVFGKLMRKTQLARTQVPTRIPIIGDQEFLATVQQEILTSTFVYTTSASNAMNKHTIRHFVQTENLHDIYLKEIPPYEVLTEKTLLQLISFLPDEVKPFKGTDLHLRYG